MPNSRAARGLARATGRTAHRDYTVPSVDAAVRILRWLGGRRGPLSEVGAALGISKSTAFAILRTLEREGLVEHDGETRRYSLGVELLALGEAAAAQLDDLAAARVPLSALVAETGLTGLVARPIERGLLIVHTDEGTADVRATMSVGQVVPLGAGAVGKAHLAFSGTDPRRAGWRPVQYTPRTIVGPARYAAELETTRKRGYATSVEEYRLGVNAVAAPVFDRRRRVVLIVSLIGFASSLTKDTIGGYGERIAGAGLAASRRLGWRGASGDRS